MACLSVTTGPAGADTVLRVGLATDLARVDLPCCDTRHTVRVGDQLLDLGSTTRVEPGGDTGGQATYRLQVAALKDQRQAQGFAASLEKKTQLPADVVFDAGTDLYRVRAGRFASREQAERARGGLQPLGLHESWIVSEGGQLQNAALVVRQGAASLVAAGRWLEVNAPEEAGIRWDGVTYRGKLLVFLNDRGRLNVINELPLEEYLRGVVPREMGPAIFDQLEALKAQTVAARTYTVRNLGEFAEEGYDICSTPRCQVYGGKSVEHPLSDRAISETAGLVALYRGEPIDALYSATSGGHTEDVGTIFPLKKDEVYLRGTPDHEAGPRRLEGNLARGSRFPGGLVETLMPRPQGQQEPLAARLERLAQLARLTLPSDRLKSLQRREVARYLASIFDLVLDRRLVRGDLAALVAMPPPDWAAREIRLARFLLEHGLEVSGPEGELPEEESKELLFELALYAGVLREENASFLSIDKGGRLQVRAGKTRPSYPLPANFATFARKNGRLAEGPLELYPGDQLKIYWRDKDVVALQQPIEAWPVNLDRQATRRIWSIFKSDGQIRAAVRARYPGFNFRGFQILSRGVSGRVAQVRLLGDGNQEILVEGLAVRWTFDVWDTLFEVQRTKREGKEGWLFEGKGWGHGVGLSQAGAYGMAARGATFREILEHYYAGIDLGKLEEKIRPRLSAP
jgi:stage II sporulation protein D